MSHEPSRRIARINRRDLLGLESPGTNPDRGRKLRLLLQAAGIDADQIFRIEYFPYRHCWVLVQEAADPGAAQAPRSGQADDLFYLEVMGQFRRAAQLACARSAAQSSHFARYGCAYQLPHPPEPISPADLAALLGGQGLEPGVRFSSEGGWISKPSPN